MSRTDPAERYRDLRDRRLAAALATEDAAEDHGLDPDTRTTCHTHRTWATDCADRLIHRDVTTWLLLTPRPGDHPPTT